MQMSFSLAKYNTSNMGWWNVTSHQDGQQTKGSHEMSTTII